VGIPSKVATGLVYFHGSLGYHMWTEVYVDGAWRAVDAALGQEAIDATHIKLGESPLSHGFVDEGVAALVPLISALDMTLVDYLMHARSTTDDQPGWHYVSPAHGLSFEPPAGWSPPRPEPPSHCPGAGASTLCVTTVLEAAASGDRALLRLEPRPAQGFELSAHLDKLAPDQPASQYRRVELRGRPGAMSLRADGSWVVGITAGESIYTLHYDQGRDSKEPESVLETLLQGIHLNHGN
jgi:hypothetical protein